METEADVARHYTHGALERAILDALTASGKDIEALAASDLSAMDEFHLGGRAATLELGKDLGLKSETRVLDIGSGIGGPARTFAETCGCQVAGIDLTPEFVEVADYLTRRTGLADKVSFKTASALAIPFEDGAFDAATLLHVGMNIEDKPKLFAEARRVLKAGARFCVYDVMRVGQGALTYPVPWAATSATSFVETPDTYRRLLGAAGFSIESEQSRVGLAREMIRRVREQAAAGGPPTLGLHILIGPEMPIRFGNLSAAIEREIVAPIELIARAA